MPSQYRLSNTLYGEAYQVARSGVCGAPPAARAARGLGRGVSGRRRTTPSGAAPGARRRARQTEIDERIAEIQAGGGPRRSHVCINLAWRRLRDQRGAEEHGGDEAGGDARHLNTTVFPKNGSTKS